MNLAKAVKEDQCSLVSKKIGSFVWRLSVLLLFMVPIVYIGALLAVVIHEILGHGLAALCVGGEFKGFLLKWDVMGYAFAYPPASAVRRDTIVILSAGVVATILSGIAFLILAFIKKHQFFTHIVFLLFATHCLLEGLPYTFWNAYNPAPPGDINRILALSGSSFLRWFLMFLCGALTVIVIIVMNTMIFRAIEQWVGFGRRLQGNRRLTTLFLLFASQVFAWFSFDWNQIAQGLGHLPNIVGVGITFVTVVALYFWSPQVSVCKKQVKEAVLPIVIAWSLMGLLCLAIWLWFSQGLTWA